ncbi:CLIP-associating protein 1-A-like isoform X18 [Bolinopsis microptera]|uniref:CLIP-associating protein 1-A-like isoform X18 n=1 Tax=Bolinopsis microptera TaxID=2820187 RepID=UPI00307AD501
MNIVDKLEDLENQVWSSDLYVRQEASSELLTVLSEANDEVFDGSSFQWDSMCGGLARWISGTNFKISLVALKAITMIATRMGEDLAPTLSTLLPAIIDRLGDTKDSVRKEAASLIQVLMSYVKTPKTILDEIVPKVMDHKNAKVREGMLLCISETLQNFGHKELSISKVIPSILELASDNSAPVRDQAVDTLCEVYKLVGEPIRNDILKRRTLPFQKEKMIIQRFDDLFQAGLVNSDGLSDRVPSDESLNSEPEKVKTVERGGGKISKSTSSGTLNKRAMPLKKSASSHKAKGSFHTISPADNLNGGLVVADSGLLTEENLDEYIKDYNTVNISSPKELADFCNACADIMENSDDWEKRIVALRDLRGVMFCGVDHFKGFKLTITGMSRAIEKTVKDLRSQVVREACVTVSAMSTELGNDFGSCGEKLLTALFSQLLVNVKIMNLSAHVCLRRVIACTQYPKMLPIICEQMKSKSPMCRKRAAEYIELIFQLWELNIITKNLSILEGTIKSGINDADSDTRIFSRRTFWLYNEFFPKNAENMMKTFDTSKKKMLQETKMGKSAAPGAGATNTLKRTKKNLAPGSSATLPKKPTMSKSTPDLSQLGKPSTLPRQPKTPARVQGVTDSKTPVGSKTPGGSTFKRHSGQYSSYRAPRSTTASPANEKTRQGVVKSKSTVLSPSLSRDPATGVKKSKSGVMRSKIGPVGGSLTQPRQTAARSGSATGGVRRSVSARSVNSIVSSETRSATLRRANNRASPGRASPASTSSSRTAAQQTAPRTPSIRKSASANLNQDSLASAFGRGTIPRMTSQDSIASSTDSSSHDVIRYRRRRLSSAGSNQSSVKSRMEDIQEIVRASESSSWKIREEGVHKLKVRINEERGFNTRERRMVLHLFEQMLNDNHAKILGTTLDVLDEFLALYRTNLTDWGATILAKALYLQSMKQTQSNFDRVMRLLDTLHRSFPYDLQLTWCFSILDSRQVNSNAKMKGTLLEYMSCTFEVMDPMEFIQTKESTIGLKVLLQSSTDPKRLSLDVQSCIGFDKTAHERVKKANAPDIRKKSATLIATMFRHSPPVFSSILNTVTEQEQGQCVMLLQETVPNMMSQESEVLMGYPGYNKIVSDHQSATSEESASLFDAINQSSHRFGSSPGSYTFDVDAENINPDILNSPVSKISLDKDRENSFSEQRDRSLTAELQAVSNLNNNTNGGSASSPLLQSPSLNGSMAENNKVFAVLEALLGGTQDEKSAALIESLNLLKEDTSINEENSYDLLSAIMSCTEEDDTELVSKSLKVLNKFLVYQADYMAPHCEEVVTKIVRAKCPMQHADSESLYQLLVMVYKTEAILNLLVPMLQHETYPVLLSVINLLYSTLKQNTPESQSKLESRLPALCAAVCPQCSHVETNVRKQSIFCLVELLLIFGTERVDTMLDSLTVSQKKLVYLYYNRHQRNVR